MKPSQKLIQRLKTELGIDIPDDVVIKTLRTGRHQKAAGAWSWCLWSTEHTNVTNIGSTYTVADLIKAPKIVISRRFNFSQEIIPD